MKSEWDKRLNIKDQSTEYCFIIRGSVLFTSHGDSGSIFHQNRDRWVGPAFGGSTKNEHRTAYIIYRYDFSIARRDAGDVIVVFRQQPNEDIYK